METTDNVTEPTADPAATLTEWSPELATVLTGAAELARAAIVEFSGDDTVGEYLGVGYEDPTSATHRFLADLPGYQGWQWAVVVASYPGADHATVSEVVLVPGPTALLAPQWVPWDQRIRPATSAPGTCWRRCRTTRGWCPVSWPPVTHRSTKPPPRSGWDGAG